MLSIICICSVVWIDGEIHMPVSSEINTKKVKTRSEDLCDKIDVLLTEVEKSIMNFSKIKKNLEYEPGVMSLIKEKELASEADLESAEKENTEWKTQVKNDVKEALLLEKRKQKKIKTEQRKMLGQPQPVQSGGKKRKGSFI